MGEGSGEGAARREVRPGRRGSGGRLGVVLAGKVTRLFMAASYFIAAGTGGGNRPVAPVRVLSIIAAISQVVKAINRGIRPILESHY